MGAQVHVANRMCGQSHVVTRSTDYLHSTTCQCDLLDSQYLTEGNKNCRRREATALVPLHFANTLGKCCKRTPQNHVLEHQNTGKLR
jgi:hypothetical protein